MPAYAHEVAEAEEEGVRFRWLTIPVRYLGDERLEAVECRLRGARRARRVSGRRRPRELPGSEFLLSVDTVVEAIGQRPRTSCCRGSTGSSSTAAGSSSTRRRAAPGTRSTSPQATRSTAARRSSRPCAAAKLVAATASTPGWERSREGDPLARARRPGREDRVAAARERGTPRGQQRPGVPGVRARAPRRAAAGVHAHRRAADPAARLDHASRRGRRARAVAAARGRRDGGPEPKAASCS